MKIFFVFFTAFLLSLPLAAQTLSKPYQVTAMVGDSVLLPGKLYIASPEDVIHIEVSAASGTTGYQVRAQSLQMVLERNVGAAAEVIKPWNFPARPEACVAKVSMPRSDGKMKFTIVLQGFYKVQDGKRKSFNVPIADRSFPIEVR